MSNNDKKPKGQNEKYKELCSLSGKLSRDIDVLMKRRRTVEKLIRKFIQCEFCNKHFKKIPSNLSKDTVYKTEVQEEYDSYDSSVYEFYDSKWIKNEYSIYYKPYICPYCYKAQLKREHVEDYHILFIRKIE